MCSINEITVLLVDPLKSLSQMSQQYLRVVVVLER